MMHVQCIFNMIPMDETRRFHTFRPASERSNLCNEAAAE
jgi:hypothetical protein